MLFSENWRVHNLNLVGAVELVPTAWVARYRGHDVSKTTNLQDGSIVNLDQLWQNILKEGLHDPLIMRYGTKTKTCRLEAGNHRIEVFLQHNITEIPVTVEITQSCGPDAPNNYNTGSHTFDATDIIKKIQQNSGYVKPSDVFTNIYT